MSLITVTSHWRHGALSHLQLNYFFQLSVLANIKESMTAKVTDPLWGESTGDKWIPLTRGYAVTRKRFPCHDVIMFYYGWTYVLNYQDF